MEDNGPIRLCKGYPCLECAKFFRAESRLTQDAAKCSGGDFTVLRHSRSARTRRSNFRELYVAARLSSFRKSCRFEFAFDFAERQRFHAALMSTSISLTRGVIVATGGVK